MTTDSSGLLISWEMEAARRPTAASFSALCRAASRLAALGDVAEEDGDARADRRDADRDPAGLRGEEVFKDDGDALFHGLLVALIEGGGDDLGVVADEVGADACCGRRRCPRWRGG